jgi:GNAT superfamily N-acetyltransferase
LKKTDEGADPITIRPATSADGPQLAGLCGQLGYPALVEQVEQRLVEIQGEGNSAVLVAERMDGRVVGWVQVLRRQLLVVDRHAELGGLVVDEEVRRHGIGRLLMERAEAWASEQGCSALYLRSNVARSEAPRFYQGAGYRQIKTQRAFWKDLGQTS